MLISKTMVYQCPHCGKHNELGVDMIGEVVACQHCERPFKLEAPAAFPVSESQDQRTEPVPEVPRVEHPLASERVLLVRHPAVFRYYLGYTALAIILLMAGTIALVSGLSRPDGVTFYLGLAGILIGLAILSYWWARSRLVTLTLTTQRTIQRFGLIGRHTTEVEHQDVRNIQLNQTGLERILQIGSLSISSAGQDTLEIHARGFAEPDQIITLIRQHQE